MQAVILAGGLGTRLAPVLNGNPKCLAPVGGSNILHRLIDQLSRDGFDSIVVIGFHLSHRVLDYINLIKPSVKAAIYFVEESSPGGTAGAILAASPYLEDTFVLVMGDLVTDFSFHDFYHFSTRLSADVSLVTRITDHPEDSDLILVSAYSTLHQFSLRLPDRSQPMNGSTPPLGNTGIFFFSRHFALSEVKTLPSDIHEIISKILDNQRYQSRSYKFCYYFTSELIRDVGSITRLAAVNDTLQSPTPSQRNRRYRLPALFLDKDNTLVLDPAASIPSNISLIRPTLLTLLKSLSSTHRVFIVSNQPGIAKGFFTHDQVVNHIFQLMSVLYEEGISVSDFAYCPHHPHSGFEGEVKDLKISCNCRKPKPQMILDLGQKWNIDLAESIFIGDSTADQLLAQSLSLKFINANHYPI